MKHYTVCSVCGARAMIEYGSVLREHSWPKAGAGGVRSICHGPRQPKVNGEPDHGQPGTLSGDGGRPVGGASSGH